MEQFLADIERRALVMAELATHDREEALDIVQDAMLAFARHYGNRSRASWPALFHRILQNRIRDWHRRRARRGRWWVRLWTGADEGEEAPDPIQRVADPNGRLPEEVLMGEDERERILAALERLPPRQQQAFLLRVWEALDTEQAARAMGCSTGSVKTHLSRAMQTLRAELET